MLLQGRKLKFRRNSQIRQDRQLVEVDPRFVIVAIVVIEQILSVISIQEFQKDTEFPAAELENFTDAQVQSMVSR